MDAFLDCELIWLFMYWQMVNFGLLFEAWLSFARSRLFLYKKLTIMFMTSLIAYLYTDDIHIYHVFLIIINLALFLSLWLPDLPHMPCAIVKKLKCFSTLYNYCASWKKLIVVCIRMRAKYSVPLRSVISLFKLCMFRERNRMRANSARLRTCI